MARLRSVVRTVAFLILSFLSVAAIVLWLAILLAPPQWHVSYKGESVYAAIGNRSGKIADVMWEWSDSQRYYLIAVPNKWLFGRVAWCNPGSDFRGYSFGWEHFRVTSYASVGTIEKNPAIFDNLGLSDSELRLLRFRRAHESVHDRLEVAPWLLVAACAVYPVFVSVGAVRHWRNRRRNPNVCVNCRYDLTGNESGVCPECGIANPHRSLRIENS